MNVCTEFVFVSLFALLSAHTAAAQEASDVNDPTKSAYGERNDGSPLELGAFSFLIGKCHGKGKTRLENGTFAEFSVTWIGRYILDGTAIADEIHSVAPDGSPYLGITFRQFDPNKKAWIVEFLNVSGSFLRKQVNGGAGSVTVEGRNVMVASENPTMAIREHYEIRGDESWVYRLDVSNDGGKTWNEGQMEMTLYRSKQMMVPSPQR
jgi:hypothetical protein